VLQHISRELGYIKLLAAAEGDEAKARLASPHRVAAANITNVKEVDEVEEQTRAIASNMLSNGNGNGGMTKWDETLPGFIPSAADKVQMAKISV